ncbi:MAG: Gfo/Idh/MocA family oxidoreductase [Planctomycetaceae bacterium]|nr:Gfo/Idh/MocA family oxidoreductase [Planctomycetaceae bacterium]
MTATINIGLIGAGWFGREAHLANLLKIEDVEVIAASSRSDESLQQVQAMAGNSIETFTDWQRVLEIEAVDAVVIALTNDQHHAAAMAAFAAGKHVLCEKPLGLTIPECNEIIAASTAAKRVLQVGHEMRFQRMYQEMKSMIDQGQLGNLHLMWCREFRGPMRPGWRSSQSLTGGTILEKNCHHFDLFNWMIERPPVKVAALGGRDVLLDREILDNAQVLVEYEDGRRASLELCLFAPDGGATEIGVVGSAGRIDTLNQALQLVHHDFETATRHEIEVTDSIDEAGFTDASGRIDRGILPELEHFIDCCRQGTQPLTDGPSARLSVAVCLAAQESIRRGAMVTLEEILDH